MATRAVCLLVGLGFIVCPIAMAEEAKEEDGAGYHHAADRAEAMLARARERLLELRDGIKPKRKRWPFADDPKKPRGAKARAEALIADYQETGDPDLAAYQPGAYTVLGRHNLALAAECTDMKKMNEARQAYVAARRNYMVVLNRFRERKEYREEATYFVGLCYDKLEGDERNGREWAICYWLEVIREFPRGHFAKQAAQDLKRVGYEQPE